MLFDFKNLTSHVGALFLIVLLSFQTSNLKSQVLNGQVTDEKGEKVAFCHIFNETKKLGSTSNLRGRFTIEASLNDRIIISAVGYKKSEYLINELHKNTVIQLERDSTMLQEIVVYGVRFKKEPEPMEISGMPDMKIKKIRIGNSFHRDPNLFQFIGINLTIEEPSKLIFKGKKKKRKLNQVYDLANRTRLYDYFTKGEILTEIIESFDIEKSDYLHLFDEFYQTHLVLFDELSKDEIKASLLLYISEMI